MKTINVAYYAHLREKRGLAEETIDTTVKTVRELYQELEDRHHFHFSVNSLSVAINEVISPWQTELKNNDLIVFIPPVSGG